MRKYQIPQPMTVEYMLSDHLGSTSLTADANGNKVLEIRYKAWGEIRATWTSSPSTTPAYKMPLYQYTGQAAYLDDPLTSGVTEGFGLMFYNARWYDPYLNHFTQADTIIPGGVQGLDRYAGMNNNPVRYNDPSGHNADCGIGEEGCKAGQYTPQKTTLPAKPSVQSACGFGAGTACSNRDVNFLPNENTKTQYGYSYPLQTVLELLEGQGFPVDPPSDVQYDERNPQKLIVGETLLTKMQNDPTQQYILIGHSAGAVPVIYAANQAQDQVAALILLDPDYTYQTQNGIENINVNLPKEKVYIGYSSQGINDSSDHYFGLSGPYAHTQLSTDTNVATSIYNFIMNAITGR